MPKFNRRQLMAAGAAIAAGGMVGPLSTVADEHDEGEENSALPPFTEPDSWSSYYGTAGNTGSIPTNGAFPEPETLAWEHNESGHVAVADGQVYLRSGPKVHALDDGDGSVVWTSGELGAEGGVEYGTPAVASETVVVGGDGLMALDADSGEVRWSQEFDTEGGEAVTSPTIAFDTVFIVADESLHAFDLADGSLRWSQESVELEPHEDSESDESQEVTFVSTPAAVANEFVYAGVGHDDLEGIAAFDVGAGETQWTYTVDETMTPEGVHDYILATENRIYTGTISDIGLDSPVLDSRTGEEVAREGEYVFRPAVTDEVQVVVERPGFTVRNLETGDEWRGSGGGTDAWRQPAIAGETLVIPHFLGNGGAFEGVARDDGVYGFDLTDGTEQWYFTHPDVNIEDVGDRHGFIVSGETIYVTGADQLQALRPEAEEPEEPGIPPVRIVSVDVETEHIILTNEGDQDIDLSGYIVNYHWDRDLSREAGLEDTIPDNVVIEAGGELVLDTGCTDVGADVRLGDYGNCQYRDDREFIIALLTPDRGFVDTHSVDEQPEEEEPEEEESEDELEEEEPEDDPKEEPEEEEEPVEDDPSLELSVSAPDSVAHGETACFDVTVWNHGEEAVEVTITLEVGDVTESSTVEIAARDCYGSFHTVAGSDLPVGDTEWTITADGASESGTLTVTEE